MTHKGLIIAAGIVAAATAACSSGSSSSIQVTVVPQPPSASAVAQRLGLTGFTDCGSSPIGGVTDAGTGYKGSVRYGVDTFPSQDIRDGWLKTAEKLGVAPAWEGSDWVAYKATSQSAKGCGK
jgi:hypothetical protein